ncbi:plasmid recombination protein (plasmid) [Bacillus cereus]|uniref:plasmid recombination protein n=1 Tax=Bacillus cereus TaxID=1396 RepID=UPI001F30F69D|nr:plasmid recombination protein [Bacillus cereus]UIJ70214.1 plasmid recombination protein [Bacillus cereus]
MLRSISFNQSYKSSISHNNRENTHGNSGIDPSRLEENIYFVQKDIRSVYKEVFQEAVDTYNEKQKRNDRKIQDYYGKIKKSEKVHEQRELVVAIGEGKEDPMCREEKKEALRGYAEVFQERNPNLAVYNMVLHDDEANPHLHINYVPHFSSSRGLTKRVGMDRALQQQGVEGKGMELIANWRALETAYIETLAKEHIPDFERANVGSHKYMKVKQYKEYAEAKSVVEKQVQAKETYLQRVDKEVKQSEGKVEELHTVQGQLKQIVRKQQQERKGLQKQVGDTKEEITKLEEKKERLEKDIQGFPLFDMRRLQAETEKVGLFKNKEVKTGNYILTKEDAQKLSKRLRGISSIKEGLRGISESKNSLESREVRLNEREEFINQKELDISYKELEVNQRERKLIGKEAAIENGQTWWEEKQSLQEQVNRLTVENSRLKRTLNKVNELYEGLKMSFVNVAKAVGMMKYSKKEYEQSLNERGNRLVDAIANYTSYWLRKMGSEDLAEKVDKEIGLSEGIQQSVQALEPKKERDRGFEHEM